MDVWLEMVIVNLSGHLENLCIEPTSLRDSVEGHIEKDEASCQSPHGHQTPQYNRQSESKTRISLLSHNIFVTNLTGPICLVLPAECVRGSSLI